MRARTNLLAAAWALLAAGCFSPAARQAADWRELRPPALRPFKPQQPQRLTLPNGMLILLQEDRELPLIRGRVRIRGGSREESAAKVGLVSIYAQAWRTGGSVRRGGDALDDFLEMRAAKVETWGEMDSTGVSFNCLKEDFEAVFSVVEELLFSEPAFPQDKLELAKRQLNTGIARRNDSHAEIAAREAAKLVYGADSPYARVPEYATVKAVTREDLAAWHRDYVHPNNAILSIVGDFDPLQMAARLEKSFGAWPRGPAAAKTEPGFPAPKPGVYVADKEDVKQSNLRLVHLGITMDNPDYFAVQVMNRIFGGSFGSRLVTHVRSRKGLAYAVRGGVGAAMDHPGLFQVMMGTKTESTAAGIDALLEEIDALRRTPPTPEELQRAKDGLLNSFVFRFDSREKTLEEQATLAFYGYPPDFLDGYEAAIRAVTAADVMRVADRYVHRDKLAILVVGNTKDFDRDLSGFGPVTRVDLTIPRPDDTGGKPGT